MPSHIFVDALNGNKWDNRMYLLKYNHNKKMRNWQVKQVKSKKNHLQKIGNLYVRVFKCVCFSF